MNKDHMSPKSAELEKKKELQVQDARTSLFIPFTLRVDSEDPLNFCKKEVKKALLDQTFQKPPSMSLNKKTGEVSCTIKKPQNMWVAGHIIKDNKAKQEVNELTPPMRDYLRGDMANGADQITCLKLSDSLKTSVIDALAMRLNKDDVAPVLIKEVKLYIYPLNTMILDIDIDWGSSPALNPTELLKRLDIARHTGESNKSKGWVIKAKKSDHGSPAEGSDDRARWDEAMKTSKTHLGGSLSRALCYEATTDYVSVNLSDLLKFILSPIYSDLLFQSARYAQHHTSMILNHSPSVDLRDELLFRLRRGYGESYVPPMLPASEFSELKRERDYEVRGNRWYTIAREGAASLSWLDEERESQEFDETWCTRWAGVYKLLVLQAISEQVTLSRLEQAASGVVIRLNLSQATTQSLEFRAQRDDVKKLTALMVRYSLAMSAEDCGGVTDYADLFSNIRQTLRTPKLRDELRKDLQEVLGLVELLHSEELAAEERMQTLHDRKQTALERQMNQIIFAVTPALFLTAFFGMNNDDLPKTVSYWWIVCASLILGAMCWIWKGRDKVI